MYLLSSVCYWTAKDAVSMPSAAEMAASFGRLRFSWQKAGLISSPVFYTAPRVTRTPRVHESRHMKAVERHGKEHIQMNSLRSQCRWSITDLTDIFWKSRKSTPIYLWVGTTFWHRRYARKGECRTGDFLGHEIKGIVDDDKSWKRSVVCFEDNCGKRRFCKQSLFFYCQLLSATVMVFLPAAQSHILPRLFKIFATQDEGLFASIPQSTDRDCPRFSQT